MPAAQTTILFPEEAEARAQDIFEVVIEQWGTDVGDRWPLSTVSGAPADQPGFPFSPAGVVIGPRSTVDRAWLAWNTQKQWPPPPSLEFESFLYRTVSLDSPLLFAQPAGTGVMPAALPPATFRFINEAMRRGLVYFFPSMGGPVTGPTFPANTERIQSTILPTNYFKADGSLAAFPAGGVPTNDFDPPVLHLQFLLKKDLLPPAPKRFPYIFKGGSTNFGPGFQDEYPIGFMPAFGRKNIIIEVHGSEANMVFRIGAIRGINQFVPYRPHETTEGLKTAGVVDSTVRFQLCGPCADYVIIYAKAAVAFASTANFTFTACD